jgi:hypothetical protein
MVRVVNEDGSVFHEPPYTEEEEMELYRSSAMGPRSSFTRPTGPAKHAAVTENQTAAAPEPASPSDTPPSRPVKRP